MLSNTATPKYYGEFREKVRRGIIPVCETISMEMNIIDDLIRDPRYYYDDKAVEGVIAFCEDELTLTDGSDLHLLDTFKLWLEHIFGWYYFADREIFTPTPDGKGYYEKRLVKNRLINKFYLIVARGAAKTLFDACIQAYELLIKPETTHQITTAPTMKQAEEVMSPIRTAIARAKGPLFSLLTEGSINNTTGKKIDRVKLASTKKGIENFVTNSLLEVRPMTIDKLQGLQCSVSTVDEWLSGDTREDVIGPLEQGGSKLSDYLIIATSSEGTVRNGVGDTMKIELMKILKGEYNAPNTAIWWYKLDNIKEINNPRMWVKANPNIGKIVSFDAYQRDVERAEKSPSSRNDILAKRFGIPMEGYTYFFTYDETLPHRKQSFRKMNCSIGADLSQGDDFCAFTFLFPLGGGAFGIKCRSYISSRTYDKLPTATKIKYDEFIREGSLEVIEGVVLDMDIVYENLDKFMEDNEYDPSCIGYDPYNATKFIDRWNIEHGEYGTVKVIQGSKTESVPLGEIKKLSEEKLLIFDESIMTFAMGNAIAEEDSNGNRKLTKRRYADKIDNVAALLDAYIAYKDNKEEFA